MKRPAKLINKEILQDTLSPNHFVIKLFCHHSPQVIPFEVLAPQPPLKFVKARKASKNCAPLNLPVKPSFSSLPYVKIFPIKIQKSGRSFAFRLLFSWINLHEA